MPRMERVYKVKESDTKATMGSVEAYEELICLKNNSLDG
jgi:hypothetical protein